MFTKLRKLTAALLAGLLLPLCVLGPVGATINPTITLLTNSPLAFAGTPGVGRIVIGTITFGASDTYVAGGFTLTASQLLGQVGISSFIINSATAALESSVSLTGGNVNIKFSTQMQGVSAVTAAGTTKVVTVPTGLTANDVLNINTPIFCQLDNTATGGGGSGTWATTTAVNSCQETSTATFTLTSTAAAPAGNANFTWFIPTLAMEAAAGTPIASYTIPFTAVVL